MKHVQRVSPCPSSTVHLRAQLSFKNGMCIALCIIVRFVAKCYKHYLLAMALHGIVN